METGARERGSAGWARERPLGDGVSGRRIAAAKVPGAHTRMTAHSVSARCLFLIGLTSIRNPSKLLTTKENTFSNR